MTRVPGGGRTLNLVDDFRSHSSIFNIKTHATAHRHGNIKEAHTACTMPVRVSVSQHAAFLTPTHEQMRPLPPVHVLCERIVDHCSHADTRELHKYTLHCNVFSSVCGGCGADTKFIAALQFLDKISNTPCTVSSSQMCVCVCGGAPLSALCAPNVCARTSSSRARWVCRH